jgi:hypothetical protein
VTPYKENEFADLVPYRLFSWFFLQEIELRKALIPFIGVRVSHNQIVKGIYFSNQGQDNFHGR